MNAIDASRSVTRLTQEYFHLDERLGSVTDGFLADIVIVRGDPSRRSLTSGQVEFVMKDGIVVLKKQRAIIGLPFRIGARQSLVQNLL